MWHTRAGFQTQAFHPGIYVQPINFDHQAANIVHISAHGHAPAGSIVAAAYNTAGQDFNLGAAAAALSIEPRMIVGSVNYSRDLGTSASEAHFSSLYGGRLTAPDAVVAAASRSREAQQQLQAEQGLIRSSASFAAYSGAAAGEARLQISAADHQEATTANLGGASLINIGSSRGTSTAFANYDQGGAGAALGTRGDTNIAAEEELESSLAAGKVGRGPLSNLEEQGAAAAAGGGAATAAATAVQLQGTTSRLDLHHYHQHHHHHDGGQGQEEDSDHQGLQLERSNIGLIQHHHDQHRGTTQEEEQQQQQQQQQHNLLFSATSLSNATTSIGGGGRQRSSSAGSIACHDCGNQAKKDCQYSRCRTCCKSRGFDCATHIKSTWVPAAKRRERQQAELAALVAGAPAQPRLRFKRTRPPAGHPHHVFGTGAAPSASLDMIGGGDTSTSTGGSPPRASSTPDQLHRFNSSISVVPLLMQPPPPQATAAAAAAASSHDQTSKLLPPEVRAQAVFKCVKVTGVSDGHDEYAYQTVVKIGGRIFKGMLFDQGSDRGLMSTPSSLAELQLGARNAPSSSGLIDLAAGVYGPSGSALLGDLR